MLATNHVVVVDANFLAFILGTICPILTAILAKNTAHPAVKAILNAVLATGAGLLAASIKLHGHIDLNQYGVSIGEAMIMAWASYAGFWRPTTVAPSLHNATGKFGIG